MIDRKLRILVATHIGEPVGGITINYRNLLASSYSQRLDVNVVETSGGRLSFSERGGFKIANWLNASANVYGFVVALLRVRPDVVHIDTAQGASFAKHSAMALIARIMGVIAVMQIHCSIGRLIPDRNTLWKRYVLFILKRVHGIVTLSKEWDALLEMLPDAKICRIPNAIELHPYVSLPLPRQSFNDSVNLLFLGHVGCEKGCFDLLNAVDDISKESGVPFCLHFVGETLRHGEKDQIKAEAKARELQNWVRIHDPEYEDRKISRFAMSDIFILPSYHEGMPISVIEAMAAGLPVVATAVGGIPEQIISEQTGILVEAGNAQALANALLRLIESPAERLAMGRAGRQRAIEHYDVETRAERLITFYYQLVSQRHWAGQP